MKSHATDSEILEMLFGKYMELTADLLTEIPVKKARKKKSES
jgi:hypothetical protein